MWAHRHERTHTHTLTNRITHTHSSTQLLSAGRGGRDARSNHEWISVFSVPWLPVTDWTIMYWWTLSAFLFCLFFHSFTPFIYSALLCFYFCRNVNSYQASLLQDLSLLFSEAQYPQLCSHGSDTTWGCPQQTATLGDFSCLNLPCLFGMCVVKTLVCVTWGLFGESSFSVSLCGTLQRKGGNVSKIIALHQLLFFSLPTFQLKIILLITTVI